MTGRHEREALLRRMELFRQAPDHVVARVAGSLTPLRFGQGDVVFKQGDPGDCWYIIESGELVVTTAIGGVERELTRMFAGEFLGEIAVLAGQERTATVRAASPAALLSLSDEQFRSLVAELPELAPMLTEEVERRRSRSLGAWLAVDERNLSSQLASSEQVTIGRAQDNDLVFASVNVAEHHARLRTRGDKVELSDVSHGAGTFVNGEPVTSTALLKDGDEIVLGDQRFLFDRSGSIRVVEPRGIRIDVVGVSKTVKGGRTLLHDVSLSVLHGEFVAIVGGSGAGKTTLMDAMAGLRPATKGAVLYNGNDYYADLDQYRHVLGYVPQDDIIHRDMTVRRTLRYAARLRLPRDTSKESIELAIDGALDELGLADRQDVVIDKLSGGQRKRASIAIELLTQPRVFFLDEPTSGLDPATEGHMMRLLRRLADDGRTVVLTTHATKNVSLCDKIIVLARDGHLAYVGPPSQALEYFGVEAFDEIYDRLEEGEPQDWGSRFESSEQRQLTRPRDAATGTEAPDVGAAPRRAGPGQFLRQLRVLSARNLHIHLKPANLMPLLMQPVVISLLILSLFRSDIWDRTGDSPNAALQMIYTLDFVMFLFGLLFGAQEMVKESAVFLRERTVDVRTVPYVLSKASFLAPLIMLIAGGMSTVFWLTHRLPDRGFDVYGPLFVTLVLTGWAGMGMSLLISSVVRTSQQATDLLTPWIAPQVLFAGALFAVPSMNLVGRALSNITAVRWAFEACSRITDMKKLFEVTNSDVGRALQQQYASSFNRELVEYWSIMSAFVVIPVVLAGFVLARKSKQN